MECDLSISKTQGKTEHSLDIFDKILYLHLSWWLFNEYKHNFDYWWVKWFHWIAYLQPMQYLLLSLSLARSISIFIEWVSNENRMFTHLMAIVPLLNGNFKRYANKSKNIIRVGFVSLCLYFGMQNRKKNSTW